jgi:hypothetical protein
MVNGLYLGDAFGWDTENTAKVAITQLRTQNLIDVEKCPKAQLIKNRYLRWLPNVLKIFGYIPGINVVAGIVAIANSKKDSDALGPNHTARWIGRGIVMIISGPLLLVIDLIKYLFDRNTANRYSKNNPDLMNAFNTSHGHNTPPYPGHPIRCI